MTPTKLRHKVEAAFDGVTREGGVSWGQSQLIDAYGWSQAVFGAFGTKRLPCPNWEGLEDKLDLATAAYPDNDTCWQDLVDDPLWQPNSESGGFEFLDAVGFRYYIAAAMIRALDHLDQSPPASCLTLGDDTRKFRAYQWSLLTPSQRGCVISFIHYAEEITRIDDNPYQFNEWRRALESYWIYEELREEKEAVLKEIYSAFGDVRRGSGSSWRDAEIDDNYGTVYDNTYVDRDSCWQELVNDPEWEPFVGVGGFVFLDALGFRYYLPAAMVRTIDYVGDQPQFALTPSDDLKPSDFKAEKWAELDRPQRDCIRSFIRYQRRLPGGDSWDEAWGYWESCDED